jgi:hypothetical protein
MATPSLADIYKRIAETRTCEHCGQASAPSSSKLTYVRCGVLGYAIFIVCPTCAKSKVLRRKMDLLRARPESKWTLEELEGWLLVSPEAAAILLGKPLPSKRWWKR